MLKLIEFDYVENKGLPNEWAIEKCAIESVNLFAGKNASGKSRTLEALYSVSEIIVEWRDAIDSSKTVEWKLIFETKSGDSVRFDLSMVHGIVIIETLVVSNIVVLNRDSFGRVEVVKKGIVENVQVDPTQIAIYELAHTHQFLEILVQWADCFCRGFYYFTAHQTMFVLEPAEKNIFNLFVDGQKVGKSGYVQSIIADMAQVGYTILDLDTKIPASDNYSACTLDSNNLPRCLFVRESQKTIDTEQLEMSKGMFRVLATLIRANYLLLVCAKTPSCFTVDDLGEGLDHEYATRLARLLFDKFATSEFQLVITTNNEYVMNVVPIEYWSLIEQSPNGVRFKNRHNSQKEIEQFNFLGLNNFDYFQQSQG